MTPVDPKWVRGPRSGNTWLHACTGGYGLYPCIQVFTGSVLIPDFEGAVMGGGGHPGYARVTSRQKHTAGGGLDVPPVFHHLTTGLT